ncbi:MAG: extracellular solute-binding protein, partial [Candidatus Omnitrophota bacterium]
KVLATIKGEVPYTDPDWIKVFSLFQAMRDKQVLATGVITMVNKTAEQLFANEKCAFAFNGSWCVNVYKRMNPDLDYGVMLPPKVSDKFPMLVWGGAGSSLVVNNRSANKAQAVEFLKWLTSAEQQIYLAQATNNLPANQNALKGAPQVLSQFADAMDNSTHPNLWAVSEFPMVIEELDKGLQAIIIGEKTPAQLGLELKVLKERELKKAQNK